MWDNVFNFFSLIFKNTSIKVHFLLGLMWVRTESEGSLSIYNVSGNRQVKTGYLRLERCLSISEHFLLNDEDRSSVPGPYIR